MSFAKQLENIIEERGLKNRQIANATSIAEETISRLVNGHRQPTIEHLICLCTYLGVTPEDLDFTSAVVAPIRLSKIKASHDKDFGEIK